MAEDTGVKLDIQLMDRRLARMESRIVRLMMHLGLDPHEISPKPERKEDDTCKTSTHSTLAKRSN
jgi:Txe/YoeB family toxin of Txe-Axe toxin-antitoxin module